MNYYVAELIKKGKIKGYKTKDNTIFYVDTYSSNIEKMSANGLPLQISFKKNWYYVDGELKELIFSYKETINKRWELKNKDLYNVSIPLLIDEHSQEKYKALIENDLYKVVYDEIDKVYNFELEIIEIDEDVPFTLKSDIQTKTDSWGSYQTPFYIDLMEYQLHDDCLVPFPIKNFKRPVRISPKNAFLLLVDMFSKLQQTNYRITDVSDFRLYIATNLSKSGTRLLSVEMYSDAPFFREEIYAKNYTTLIKNFEKLTKEMHNLLSEHKKDETIKLLQDFREKWSMPK